MVRFHVIGSGDAFGSGGSLTTCFYVETPAVRLLLDCGASSLPALRRHRVPIQEIDLVVITHFHGDHYGGLPYLLLYLATYGQVRPLTIASPGGCRERLESLLQLLYPDSDVLGKLDIEFLDFVPEEPLKIREVELLPVPVIHKASSKPFGVRLGVSGKVISYSGDTEWTDELLKLSVDADLFICECCFYNRRVEGHMNYLDLRKNIHRLNCKRLFLTHLDKEMLLNLKNVNADRLIDGQVIEL